MFIVVNLKPGVIFVKQSNKGIMTATECRSELLKLQIQLNELTKIYKSSNLSDKNIQGQITRSLFIKKHLQLMLTK